MRYNTLGIAVTAQCNAECDMCCFSCSPKRKEKSLLADGTFIPLYQTGRKYNIKPYVKNYQLAPISPTVYYKNVELV
ncbi:MAG: hypothetical protein ACRC6X_02820, partial [Culicoidibacterales bacterium]